MIEQAAAILKILHERRLVFPLILIAINLASAVQHYAAGDWKSGTYFLSSSLCLLMVALQSPH